MRRDQTSILSRLWAGLSLLGAIPAFASLALLEGEGDDGGNKPPGDGGQGGAAGAGGGAGGAAQPFRSFADQAEFDKHAAGIKREAERNALKAVAEQLGCSVDEAKTFLADRKAAEDAKLSEVEKREKAAADKEAAAAVREAAATRKALLADVSVCLTTTGVRADRVTYATNAVLVDLAEDADADAIKAQVDKVKELIPEFFGEVADPSKPPAVNPSGGPRGGGPAPKSGIEAGRERGREIAAAAAARNNPLEGFRVLGRSA